MHLLILGLILVVGILVYYIMTTSAGNKGASSGKSKGRKSAKKTESQSSNVPDDLRKEDNVIFLPRKDGDDSQKDL